MPFTRSISGWISRIHIGVGSLFYVSVERGPAGKSIFRWIAWNGAMGEDLREWWEMRLCPLGLGGRGGQMAENSGGNGGSPRKAGLFEDMVDMVLGGGE